ncbi:MAG: hypothetical protein EZS28_041321 [Streblomastix strix]|uniref:Uncharacterized protein n=1 Tax=Streblomastix strix TaxID=222440 RepID=A0A5J4TZF7_9EUKA|nr:MAG: hypothetical protein EZS28_041321 [Streblomastix strix]
MFNPVQVARHWNQCVSTLYANTAFGRLFDNDAISFNVYGLALYPLITVLHLVTVKYLIVTLVSVNNTVENTLPSPDPVGLRVIIHLANILNQLNP